ncbi:MAG: Uma2 family endonuclease [Rhodocyclaceae bacterium]|nr:Uma2 family endonuclease [Rhodocyclaceae bacterium]
MAQTQRRNDRRYTYADYCRWPEGERWELIDGVAYAMGPAPARIHQKVLGELFRQVANALQGRNCEAYLAPFDVRLPAGQESDEELTTIVQPDLAVICDPSKLDEKGCRGAPDWIVEVLSPASASRDHLVKRELYERAGVAEYWLVHPIDRMVTIYRQSDAGRFRAAEILACVGQTAVGCLPELVIDWSVVFPESEGEAA